MELFASFMTDVCIMFIFVSIILGLAVKGMADSHRQSRWWRSSQGCGLALQPVPHHFRQIEKLKQRHGCPVFSSLQELHHENVVLHSMAGIRVASLLFG